MQRQVIPDASEPLQYRAVGLMQGIYIPSDDKPLRGLLQLPQEGLEFYATLDPAVSRYMEAHPETQNQPHYWSVYPRTLRQRPYLYFQLRHIRKPKSEEEIQVLAEKANEFSIRGQVLQAEGSRRMIVRICRNIANKGRKDDRQFEPFTLALFGSAKAQAGDFLDLKVLRRDTRLVIVESQFVENLSLPAVEATPVGVSGAAPPKPKTSFVKPVVRARPSGIEAQN